MEARFNPLKTLVDVGFSLYYKMILKGDEPEKIQRVMYATRLCNRDETYPSISKAKPIPTDGIPYKEIFKHFGIF